MHPQPRPFTLQLFLDFHAIFFPAWPLIFFGHHDSPSNLAKSRYPPRTYRFCQTPNQDRVKTNCSLKLASFRLRSQCRIFFLGLGTIKSSLVHVSVHVSGHVCRASPSDKKNVNFHRVHTWPRLEPLAALCTSNLVKPVLHTHR